MILRSKMIHCSLTDNQQQKLMTNSINSHTMPFHFLIGRQQAIIYWGGRNEAAPPGWGKDFGKKQVFSSKQCRKIYLDISDQYQAIRDHQSELPANLLIVKPEGGCSHCLIRQMIPAQKPNENQYWCFSISLKIKKLKEVVVTAQ
eukprot:TRINITY_DN136_c1_g1_i5.p3 TRINITY_DN136_c1_g1~~TRINITY_DN136_c1_g1_i5.p3  ORF type:complete len:145 (+),score=2.17 TRINITY_DN136_c1_g1_i5:771-1205(+)